MYISSLKLNNFCGFRNLELTFSEGLNTIIGENNAGKSSIIRALGILFSNANFSRKLSINDICHSIEFELLREVPPMVSIVVILKESSQGNREEENDILLVSEWLTRINSPYEAQLTYQYFLPDSEKDNYQRMVASFTEASVNNFWKRLETEFLPKYVYKLYEGNPEFQHPVNRDSLERFDFQFLTAIRDVEKNMYSGRNTLLRDVIDFYMDYDIKTDQNLDEREKQESININKTEFENKSKPLFESLQKRMELGKEEMLKYASTTGASIHDGMSPDFEGDLSESDLYSELKLIVRNKTGISLPVLSNGLGYNNLIYISLLLSVMQRNASKEILGDNQKLFPILAIEEPEAHLHPNLQYSFLQFLSENCNTQVRQAFITTHSPNITAAVALESINVISKENGIPICCYPSKVFSPHVAEDITSKNFIKRFLDVTKANIFFARKIIFIEGIAEELLLATFAKKIGLNLVDNNIAVVNVNGRYFQHFLKLFDPNREGYLPCKVACVTDRDPIRKKKGDANARWKTCSPLLLDADDDHYEYEACSNLAVNNMPDCKNIRIFSQDEGSTFEYEFILSNSKRIEFITESVGNSKEISEMMKAKSIDEAIVAMKSNTQNKEIIEACMKSKISEQDKIRHLIAGRFLSSIAKGRYAQELENILNMNDKDGNLPEYEIPSYLNNAIEWICNDNNT